MKRFKGLILKISAVVFVSGFVFLHGGCVSSNIYGDPHVRVHNKRIPVTTNSVSNMVAKVRPYALMSELAYRHYGEDGQPRNMTGAELEKADAADLMRTNTDATMDLRLSEQGWKFIQHHKFPCGKLAKDGTSKENLEFDLWKNTSSSPAKVVIAFTGTDDDADWGSNLRQFNRSAAATDQYARIQSTAVATTIQAVCREAGSPLEVTATGHSLGGGLAQHLFYASQLWPTNYVTSVTVFDSSAVTGWYQFGDEKSQAAFTTHFYKVMGEMTTGWKETEVMAHQYGFGTVRVNERGEILSYVRWAIRELMHEDDFMTVLNFDFTRNGNGVSQHSMEKLANSLLHWPISPPSREVVGNIDPTQPAPR